MAESVWLIDPHDPLIFRDGKPFGPTPGAYARSLPFPFPSTTTGGARTLAGLDNNGVFRVPGHQLEELKQLAVRGPLLVQLTPDGRDMEPGHWFVPAPGDALVLNYDKKSDLTRPARIIQLVPRPDWDHASTDLHTDLMLIGQRVAKGETFAQDKVHSMAPRYWHWSQFITWLAQPESLHNMVMDIDSLGASGPVQELRVHVTIDHQTHTGKDQHLFDTSGLEFVGTFKDRIQVFDGEVDSENREEIHFAKKQLSEAYRFALAVIVDNHSHFALKEGLNHLAGERRIVSWRQSRAEIPECPKDIADRIVATKKCRVILLTPAKFTNGSRPTKLLETFEGVTPNLRAIKIDRPQVVSGWDMAKGGGSPRATVRLAPAGTVLFLSFKDASEGQLRAWVRAHWMQCVSDDLQARRDGFGLAVLGVWDESLDMREERTR